MVYCELRGVRYTGQVSKKGRVLVALPSVTLGKETLYWVSSQNTRQINQFLLFWELVLPSVSSLPSVFKWTLGKVTIKSARGVLVCRVYWAWHSAKCVNVDECFGLDTRQTLQPLPSVLVLHSANFSNFTECFGDDTRQSLQTLPSVLGLTLDKLEKLYRVFFRRALGKIAVTVPSRYHFCAESFFLPSVYWHSANYLPSAR